MKSTGKDLVSDALLNNADECRKLLDNGWSVSIWRNEKGAYTAVAIPPSISEIIVEIGSDEEGDEEMVFRTKENWANDGKTPSEALHGLTESVLFGKKK
tara:strand:- start:121 stop:417 length:297 start_codon:yes stop_codon:yes gene_type:complete